MGYTRKLRSWRDCRSSKTSISPARPRGFALEAIEPRLLLSGDPLLAPFINPPHPTPPIVAVILPAATIQWDGGGDGVSWSDQQNWAGDRLPNATDDVLVSSATLIVHSNGADAVHSLKADSPLTLSGGSLSIELGAETTDFTLSGGTLTGAGQVTMKGTTNWTGGTMTGSGLTVVAPGAMLNLTGGADRDLVAHQLDNTGTVVWNAGRIRTGSGSVIWNEGLWDNQAAGDQIIFNSDLGGAMSTFVDDGTFQRSAGTGTTFTDILFALRGGTVAVQSGTLQFRNSVTSDAGAFNVASTSAAVFSANAATYDLVNSTFAGAGLIRITGGTAVLEGVMKVPRLELSGGTLDGEGDTEITDFAMSAGTVTGSGRITTTGMGTWSGGTMTGNGVTAIAAGATLSITGAADKDIVGHTLENNGTVIWNAGRIRTGSGAALSGSGLWDIQTDQVIQNSDLGGAMSSFVNSGTFRKSVTTGTSFFD